jgi:hypothetical protein
MSTYIPAFKGYMADVPEVWFKRCDDAIFHYDELTQCSVNPNVQFTEINGGWSLFPVAYVPGQGTLELQMTSAQFNADLFAMANGVEFQDDPTFQMPVTEYVEVKVENNTRTLTLTNEPVEGTVSILHLKEGPEAGQPDADTGLSTFKVEGKVITLPDDEKIKGTIEVYYETEVATAKSVDINNQAAATGEAICKWPVYAAGDDCSGSAIKGYAILKIYKARVTQMPGFDTSYKSAATNAITLSAMDAKKLNQEAYKLTFVEVAAEKAAQAAAGDDTGDNTGDNTQGGTGTNP